MATKINLTDALLEDKVMLKQWANNEDDTYAQDITAVKNFTVPPKVDGVSLGGYSGFKNYIINGKKVVNQRSLTTTDASYNQDRWYKAGNNWFQGIEGDNNLISGKKYTLSWVGVATASYYVGTATSATINAQTFIPIANGGNFTLTITAGQNLWIKFASDASGSTFNFVQLEEGNVATPFENRPYGLELSLCQRYFLLLGAEGSTTLYIGGLCSGANALVQIPTPSLLRTTPTLVGGTWSISTSAGAVTVSSITLRNSSAILTSLQTNTNGHSAYLINSLSTGVRGLNAEL